MSTTRIMLAGSVFGFLGALSALFGGFGLSEFWANYLFWALMLLNWACLALLVITTTRHLIGTRKTTTLINQGRADEGQDICTTCWYVGCCKECPDWKG